MKVRIIEFLKRIAFEKLEEREVNDILNPIGLTSGEAGRRARQLMDDLIYHYSYFQVKTIDSFINALLVGCAFKIGLSANFRIRHNHREYLQYSLDRMIDASRNDAQLLKAFMTFLHQYLFLENRPGWLPKKDMLSLLNALYEQSNTYGYPFQTFDLQGDDLMAQKNKIMSLMRDLKDQLPEGTDHRFCKSLEGFLEKYSHGFDIDRVSDYFARERVPIRKGVKSTPAVDRLWSKIHTSLRQLCEDEAQSLVNPYITIFQYAR